MTSKDRSGAPGPRSCGSNWSRCRWRRYALGRNSGGRAGRELACYINVIYCPFGRTEPHPTMNRSSPLVRLSSVARALKRQLTAAIAGTDVGVHQARVASRRLREPCPCSRGAPSHRRPAGPAQDPPLTQALGTVRELDVTLHLVDELGERPGVPRAALAEVRALVIGGSRTATIDHARAARASTAKNWPAASRPFGRR